LSVYLKSNCVDSNKKGSINPDSNVSYLGKQLRYLTPFFLSISKVVHKQSNNILSVYREIQSLCTLQERMRTTLAVSMKMAIFDENVNKK